MNNGEFEHFGDVIIKASILEQFPPEQRVGVMEKLNRGFAVGREKLANDEYLEIPFPDEADRNAIRKRKTAPVISP